MPRLDMQPGTNPVLNKISEVQLNIFMDVVTQAASAFGEHSITLVCGAYAADYLQRVKQK